MAQVEIVKNMVKPPFANYDVVVYFGCGLFSLPFINHYYVEPFGLRFPKFAFDIGVPFAGVLISTLCLLFSVYIVGHMIAYVGSQVIEKAVDTFFGKTSSAVLVSSRSDSSNRNEHIRALVFDKTRAALGRSSWLASSARIIMHIPVAPLYVLIFIGGVFGYYNSRVPSSVLTRAEENLAVKGISLPFNLDQPWFKPLEYYVINNMQVPTARMYNYLVISGVFRSLAVIFLVSLWFELYYIIHSILTSHQHVGIFMYDGNDALVRVASYGVLATVYVFCLFSFMKFQRRYVEEAIFAMAMGSSD